MKSPQKILIIGGGFGGISTALHLSQKNLPNTHITLVSNRPHFEYHGALYRLVTGNSPLEICIPLSEIFAATKVEVIIDDIDNLILKDQYCWGTSGSKYPYDYLVLSLGSQTSYFGIPGLKSHSFGFKSITEALSLKRHLHQVITQAQAAKKPTHKLAYSRFIVIGGGASGTELAAELALYTKKLARRHRLPSSLIAIDLVHSKDRLLDGLPINMSHRIESKIRSLGVNLYLHHRLTKKTYASTYLQDIKLSSHTLIWTAGVTGHPLYQSSGFKLNSRGQVKVSQFLSATGYPKVYIAGDSAATPHSGMAQTAIYHGGIIAHNLAAKITGSNLKSHLPEPEPTYAIPVGPSWAAVLKSGRQYFGRLGWFHRRLLDWQVYRFLLPFNKALHAFMAGHHLTESCPICSSDPTYHNSQ